MEFLVCLVQGFDEISTILLKYKKYFSSCQNNIEQAYNCQLEEGRFRLLRLCDGQNRIFRILCSKFVLAIDLSFQPKN